MNRPNAYSFSATLWLYPGESANWHFISLPKAISEEIKLSKAGTPRRGWGAVRVKATIGSTTWNTSIFPSKQDGCYILPIKAAVRKAERVHERDKVSIALTLL